MRGGDTAWSVYLNALADTHASPVLRSRLLGLSAAHAVAEARYIFFHPRLFNKGELQCLT
jgi:hypothetical protein